jgi:Flp pilus assembly pilin Flp
VTTIVYSQCNFELTSACGPGIIIARATQWREVMEKLMKRLWSDEQGQDIAEYAVMLAVILVLVVGTIRLIGGSSNNVFSSVASSIGQ